MLLVHNEIYYVPVGDGWEEVLVRTGSLVPFQGPKKSRFSGPIPSNAPRNDVALLKTITYRAIKATGTLIVNVHCLLRNVFKFPSEPSENVAGATLFSLRAKMYKPCSNP